MYNVTECFDIIKGLAQYPKYTKLIFDAKAYLKLMCYIHLIGDYEIGGFGRIQDSKVIDIKILRQQVRPATVDSDEIAIAEFMRSVPPQELSEWELDWHSHVNMSTYPSNTDWGNYASMQELRMGQQYPILVINKTEAYTCKNYINAYRTPDIKVDVETAHFSEDELLEIYSQCKKDIQELCTIAPLPIFKGVKNSDITKNKLNSQNYFDCASNYYADNYLCACCGMELMTGEELATGYCTQCGSMIIGQERKGKRNGNRS